MSSRRLHLAVVIDYDQGAILAGDVEMAIEDYLANRPAASGGQRTVSATAVIVSENTHQRLCDRAQTIDERLAWGATHRVDRPSREG